MAITSSCPFAIDGPAPVFDFLSKGKEGQGGEFEALRPDGDADDRNAPENARNHPAEPLP